MLAEAQKDNDRRFNNDVNLYIYRESNSNNYFYIDSKQEISIGEPKKR